METVLAVTRQFLWLRELIERWQQNLVLIYSFYEEHYAPRSVRFGMRSQKLSNVGQLLGGLLTLLSRAQR
jgi:hypothetical protein